MLDADELSGPNDDPARRHKQEEDVPASMHHQGHLHTPAPPYVAPGDTAGLRHVEEALRDLEFPMTREELLARAGAWRMPITGTEFVRLDELLAHTRQRSFGSVYDVLGALRSRG